MKVTKRQLRRIIREESDVIKSFGGGEIEKEVFADGDADEDLNKLADKRGIENHLENLPEAQTIKVTKNQLRRIIREQSEGGLPSVDDLAKKLGSAGPEAAIDFIQRLLAKANFSTPAVDPVIEEPAPPLALPDEEV